MTTKLRADSTSAQKRVQGSAQSSRGIAWRSALSFRRISALYVLVALIILYTIWVPSSFLTSSTLESILSEQAIVAIVALGVVFPLAAGVFDLSVGGSVGVGACFSSWLMVKAGLPVLPAIIVTLGAAVLVGTVNSLLINRAGIDSFIATLGMSSVLLAAVEWITASQVIIGMPQSFLKLATTKLFGVTLPVYYMLALAIVLWFVLEHTPAGRYVHATGGNAAAARLSGVSTTKVVFGCLLAAAVFATFGGILVASQIASASDTVGSAYLLPAFAAGFLGSTQIKNGAYNVWGTLIAVYVLAVGVKGLLLAGAPLWLPDLFNGLVLIIAVGLSVRKGRARVRASERRAEMEAEALRDISLNASGEPGSA